MNNGSSSGMGLQGEDGYAASVHKSAYNREPDFVDGEDYVSNLPLVSPGFSQEKDQENRIVNPEERLLLPWCRCKH